MTSAIHAIGLCVLAATTTGDSQRQPPPDKRMGLRAEIGAGTTTGMAGAVFWRDLAPMARLEVGSGLGFSGLQLSTLLRLVMGGEFHHFLIGAGSSIGIPVNGGSIFMARHGRPQVVMPWLNLEPLGYEFVSKRGWTLALTLGVTTPLRRGHWDLVDDFGASVRPLKDWWPGGHLAFGKAF